MKNGTDFLPAIHEKADQSAILLIGLEKMEADPERRDKRLHISETCAILFSLARSKPRQGQGEKENMSRSSLRRVAHNLRRRSDFVYVFARNPLKSPDSEK